MDLEPNPSPKGVNLTKQLKLTRVVYGNHSALISLANYGLIFAQREEKALQVPEGIPTANVEPKPEFETPDGNPNWNAITVWLTQQFDWEKHSMRNSKEECCANCKYFGELRSGNKPSGFLCLAPALIHQQTLAYETLPGGCCELFTRRA